ncbi:MAG: type II toxin-antitoxin system RelE/ParE family toxin [Muribaculaceae bacterium]
MKKLKFQFEMLEEARLFMKSIPSDARNKIYYNIRKASCGILDPEIFKKLENTEIWEFRTLYNKIAYRLFAFWDNDEGTFVIATHGIIKKSQKTPSKEIAKAQEIRKKYFQLKTQAK